MSDMFSRTELIIGAEALEKIKKSHVAVFGVGGVGSYTVEALARCGVGRFTIVDSDTVCVTNINRQIIADCNTVGRAKVDVMRERIMAINPDAVVDALMVFYSAENAFEFDFSEYDYVVDAIDTVTSKLLLIEGAKRTGTPIMSCMGAGNKLDPTRFEVADIYSTSVCPLARVMRRELKARGIASLKVVYSAEQPIATASSEAPSPGRRAVPGSLPFVPSVAGMIIAGEVAKDLAEVNSSK